jgi:hypothetical protein
VNDIPDEAGGLETETGPLGVISAIIVGNDLTMR